MNYEFEAGIAEVLQQYGFTFKEGKFAHAIGAMGQHGNRKVVASFVCYKEQDLYDNDWASQFADRCKNVYWLQFRDGTNDKYEWIGCEFDHYIYAPSELKSFLDNWQEKFSEDMNEWAHNMEMTAKDDERDY
jgi:hypothetical protein